MKKSTLLAAFAVVALGASAQYSVAPGVKEFIAREGANGGEINALVLGEAMQNELRAKGFTVNTNGLINDETTHWWWWDGWAGGDDSYPDPDFSGDGYISQSVTGTAGWSGGGLTVDNGAGWKTDFAPESVLHITMRSQNQPASIGIILMDGGEVGAAPAKFSIGGTAFDDNGVIYPLIGSMPADGDWACYEIKFSDLQKLWPGFKWVNTANWYGNSFCLLSGNIPGTNFGVCETFIYTPAGAGVEGVKADANAAAEYFNLQGIRVANPQHGIFIRRQGNVASKVIL